MGFNSLKGLPRLNNYADAVDYFNQTKGIRGREIIKPLKLNRRDPDTYRIVQDRNGVISCYLYATPVLQYHPDKLVINTWDSQTTCQFVSEIAPYWVGANVQNHRMTVRVSGEGQFIGNEIVLPVDEKWHIKQGEVKAFKLNQIVLNKTRAAEARKQTKGVVELARITSKMDGYWAALVENNDIAPDEETAWLKGLLKKGNYRVASYGGWRNGAYTHYEGHTGFGQWGMHTAADLLKYLKRDLYEDIYIQDKCYDKIPAAYGVIPKNWERAE